MAKKEDDLFKEWVEEISGSLKTEEERKAFEVFSASDAGRETLRGGMRRKEFDRRLNDINEARRAVEAADEKLKSDAQAYKEWYDQEKPKNAALVQELTSLKAQLKDLTGDDPPPSAQTVAQSPLNADYVKMLEDLNKKVEMFDKNLPRLHGDMSAIIKRSIQENIDIDPRDVIAYSIKHQVEPFRAYEDLTHDTRQERFEQERENEKKRWIEEGKKEALKTLKSSPDHIRTPGPSIVDYLQKDNTTPSNRNDRVSSAVKDFLELQSQS